MTGRTAALMDGATSYDSSAAAAVSRTSRTNVGTLQLSVLQMKVVLIELSGCPQSVHVENSDPSAAQID